MAEEKKIVKKLMLSDGSVYYMYDMDAARTTDLENYLKLSGGTITGNLAIDRVLTTKRLRVRTVDDREIPIGNVLTQDDNGMIQKRDADYILEDIGGVSYKMDESSGVLKFSIGK